MNNEGIGITCCDQTGEIGFRIRHAACLEFGAPDVEQVVRSLSIRTVNCCDAAVWDTVAATAIFKFEFRKFYLYTNEVNSYNKG